MSSGSRRYIEVAAAKDARSQHQNSAMVEQFPRCRQRRIRARHRVEHRRERRGVSESHAETDALYVGATYLLATSGIRSVFDLRQHPGLAQLVASVSLNVVGRVEPRNNWNCLKGGNRQPDKRWSITAEVRGLADRTQVIASVLYRF